MLKAHFQCVFATFSFTFIKPESTVDVGPGFLF